MTAHYNVVIWRTKLNLSSSLGTNIMLIIKIQFLNCPQTAKLIFKYFTLTTGTAFVGPTGFHDINLLRGTSGELWVIENLNKNSSSYYKYSFPSLL